MAARRVTLTAALKKRLFLRFALTSLLSAAERPNLVVLLGDAMGFADLGCHGSQILRPNLDAPADDFDKPLKAFADAHHERAPGCSRRAETPRR